MLPDQLLVNKIVDICSQVPSNSLLDFISRVDGLATCPESAAARQLLSTVTQSKIREQLKDLVHLWRTKAPQLSGRELALGLHLACSADALRRDQQSVELVWTGPSPLSSTMRRTEQVLLSLINSSTKMLTIVTFAAYKLPAVSAALVCAAQRGVRIQLVVESAEISDGKIAYEALAGLGEAVGDVSEVYVWPKDKRPHDADGHYGSLHVKCAIADESSALISSANLTGHAMNLNMELGALLGADVARQVSQHIRSLISNGTLCRISF